MTGVGPLFRFALRRDRLRLPLWVLLLAVLVMGTAASWERLYPTAESRLQLLAILSGNPALAGLLGPLTDPLSTGALTAWRITSGVLLVLALVNAFTVTRHVRAEEQSGRAEMMMVAPFARRAPLVAALLVALVVDLAFVVIAAALMAAVGIPFASSLLFAAGVATCAWLFAGVAAISNQVFRTSRAANSAAGGLIALAWGVSAAGNIADNWLAWVSPFGWAQRVDAFGTGSRPWLLAVALVVALACCGVALRMSGRRDLAGALIPDRAGRAAASPRLRGAHSLAWRLERPVLLGWAVAFVFLALFIGFSRTSLVEFVDSSPQLAQVIQSLGGTGPILDVFLATYIGMAGVAVGFLAVAAVLRLDAEERSGRAEQELSTVLGRVNWAAAYTVLGVVGALLMLFLLGAVLGVSFGVQGGDLVGELSRVMAAAAAWLAPAVFVAGLTMALVGLLPRWAAAAWVVVAAFAVITEFGAIFGLPDWLMNLSPFSHLSRAPAVDVALTPVITLAVAGLVLIGAGFVGVRIRDIRSTG